jgi:isatin hydrolase
MTETKPAADLAALLAGGDVIDLSVALAEDLPGSWPTHVPFQRKVFNWFGHIGPYHTGFVLIDEHCGTHVDAPAHFIPPVGSGLDNAGELAAVTIDKVELSRLIGPAAVIDVSHLTGQGEGGVSPEIAPDLVEAWEGEHGRLNPGDIVLFASGWDRFYVPMPEGAAYAREPFLMGRGPGWPTPGVPTLQLLLDRGATVVGLDGVSVGASHAGVPPHVFGLGRNMIFVELLANLDKLPPRGALFVCLPLKIAGGSAGPARAVAVVPRG